MAAQYCIFLPSCINFAISSFSVITRTQRHTDGQGRKQYAALLGAEGEMTPGKFVSMCVCVCVLIGLRHVSEHCGRPLPGWAHSATEAMHAAADYDETRNGMIVIP